MSKHDIVIMELRVDGYFIGWLTQPRTARKAWEDRIAVAEMRRLFRQHCDSAINVWRVPIIEDKHEVHLQVL